MKAIILLVLLLFFFALAFGSSNQEATAPAAQYVVFEYFLDNGKGALRIASEFTANPSQDWKKIIYMHESGRSFSGTKAKLLWKGHYQVLVPIELVKEGYRPKVTVQPVQKTVYVEKKSSENTAVRQDTQILSVAGLAAVCAIQLFMYFRLRRSLSLALVKIEQHRSEPTALSREEIKALFDELIRSPEFQAVRSAASAGDKPRSSALARTPTPISNADSELREFQKFLEEILPPAETGDWHSLDSYREGDEYVINHGFEDRSEAISFSSLLSDCRHDFSQRFPGFGFQVEVPGNSTIPRTKTRFYKVQNEATMATA